tara:strand:+ start:9598 stop:10875 length:1278 start_codon:yes stop_codon:yes gene_type:complete
MFNAEKELQKWAPVLDHADATPIKDNYRRAVTAKLLENTERACNEERGMNGMLTEAPNNTTGSITSYDPVLISLVRRAMPNLIAYDVAGVQPMSGPTGLIFAMKSRYGDGTPIVTGDPEAGFNEADTDFGGAGTHAGTDPTSAGLDSPESAYTTGTGIVTATGEAAGPAELGFTIEKATVTAKTRQLKAEYSMELAQDLKAIHGLDAEAELANILSAEILAEVNREVIRSINSTAKTGASNVGTDGLFDMVADADGRWAIEKFKSLIYQLEVEANKIAQETRRGKGNFVIASSNVASALAAAGQLDYAPAMATDLNVDDTGNTFAGVLNGRLKVYVDPYAGADYATVGYRGTNPYDAGLFYCPYVPLTMVRAVDETTFQPKIAFKTRYGLQANPFVTTAAGIGSVNSNQYFRNIRVGNINVGGQS